MRASMNSHTTPHTADRSQLVPFPTEHTCAHEPPPISQPSLHARSYPAIQTPITQPYPVHLWPSTTSIMPQIFTNTSKSIALDVLVGSRAKFNIVISNYSSIACRA